jgi:hypothetical protein
VLVSLKDERRSATIDCTTLRFNRNSSSEYLVGPLTSSNIGWHAEWFYLKNDPECSLLAYTAGYYYVTPEAWSDRPSKKDHQKLLSGYLEVLKALQGHRFDLTAVIGGYLTRGIVLLRW